MVFFPVAEILATKGLRPPSLNALVPSIDNYEVMLFQPEGYIDITGGKVRHRDSGRAIAQFAAFVAEVIARQPDLCVTPEYSFPWEVLVRSLEDGFAPDTEKLWAFGCESITYTELQELQDRLTGKITVLYEELNDTDGRFLDPIAFVFKAPDANGDNQLVVLVQFKTHPMSDPGHFEINGLATGTRIYIFGQRGETIRLAAMICSDAMVCNDYGLAAEFDERAVILHLQLNPEPRHREYRRYRDELFNSVGDTIEVVALNWARNVSEWDGICEKKWGNIAGSAWYLRPDKFDDSDPALLENHRRGLYYTWFADTRSHALFFNYDPAIYILVTTKAWHHRVSAAQSRRKGPSVKEVLKWSTELSCWKDGATEISDGFEQLTVGIDPLSAGFKAVAAFDPISSERLFALSAGAVRMVGTWYGVKKLDAFHIDTRESLQRLTFAQDRGRSAEKFRKERLYQFKNLETILLTGQEIPPALADLKKNYSWSWSSLSPNCNVQAEKGPATVMYVGEAMDDQDVKSLAECMAENLYQYRLPPERFAIWYRRDGVLRRYDLIQSYSYDQTSETSAVDIAREG